MLINAYYEAFTHELVSVQTTKLNQTMNMLLIKQAVNIKVNGALA